MIGRTGFTLLLASLIAFVPYAHGQSGAGPTAGNLPSGARICLGTLRLRETQAMSALEFLPGGTHLATASGPLVHYWNLQTGAMDHKHTFSPEKDEFGFIHSSGVLSPRLRDAAISPDGKWLACVAEGELYLAPLDPKNLPEYVKVGDRFGARDRVAVAFATIGGAHLVAALDTGGGVRAFTRDGKDDYKFGAKSGLADAAFFAVGKSRCVVANREGLLVIIDLEKHERVGHMVERDIRDVSLAADGRYLAIRCNKGDLILYDLEKNEQIARRKIDAGVLAVEVTPGGRSLLTWKYDGPVELVDLKTDKVVLRERLGWGHSQPLMRFSGDGKRCAAHGGGGAIRVWETATGKSLTAPALGHLDPITCLRFLDDRNLLSAGMDATVRRWDPKTGKASPAFTATHGVHDWVFSKDGKEVFFHGPWEQSIRVRKLAETEERALDTARESIRAMALAPNGKLLAFSRTSNAARVHLKALDGGKPALMEIPGSGVLDNSSDLVFATDDTLLARSSRGVQVWDVKKQEMVREFNALAANYFSPPNPVCHMIVTANGKLVAGPGLLEMAPIIGFWEIESGKLAKHFTTDGTHCTVLAMASDDKLIVMGDKDGGVHVWDVANGERVLHQSTAHRGAVTAIAIAADNRSFATGGADTTILVWDMPARRN